MYSRSGTPLDPRQRKRHPSRCLLTWTVKTLVILVIVLTSQASSTAWQNEGIVWQHGDENLALLTQVGMGNTAAIFQGWGDEYRAGTNLATIDQTGEGNLILSIQFGLENLVRIQQEGHNNRVFSWQDGSLNYLTVSQIGNNNRVLTVQEGNHNEIDIIQLGDGNRTRVLHSGGMNFSIVQLGN